MDHFYKIMMCIFLWCALNHSTIPYHTRGFYGHVNMAWLLTSDNKNVKMKRAICTGTTVVIEKVQGQAGFMCDVWG